MEKDIQRILVSREEIQSRVNQLGELLSEEYADKNPVVVGVLKGVVIFFARLIERPCAKAHAHAHIRQSAIVNNLFIILFYFI